MPWVRRYALCWVAVVGVVVAAGSARSEEFYYVAVFGSQEALPNPNYTHSFAAFVKATGCGPCPKEFVVEECFSISWLPRTLKVRTRALCPECGINLPLHAILKHVLDEGQRVSLWGPYRIEPELYYKARAQAEVLESGRVRYKAVDAGYNTDRVSNCIHALTSITDGYRARVLSPGFGDTASWVITQRYGEWIIDSNQTHEWVYAYLGLEQYPIIRRDFTTNPRTGFYWGLLKRGLGTAH
jgi:hypothetical protein